MAEFLPVVGQSHRERGDAAANRARILEAARAIVERCSADELTMDNVAELAGVGKGTVFRRFDSRAGLMAALVNDFEAEWQGALISGPPPLGPGASPLDRLLAFGPSRIDLVLGHSPLFEAAGRVLTHNPAVFGFLVRHLELLLGELDVEGDVPMLASALIAPLGLETLRRQVDVEGLAVDRIKAAWMDLARRVVG